MGLCGEENPEKKKTKIWNKFLKDSQRKENQIVKLLLLGAGASGKSTIFKQMKIIHLKGYDEKEREDFKISIYNNICNIFTALIDASRELKTGNIDAKHSSVVKYVMKYKTSIDSVELNPKIGKQLTELWKDSSIVKAYERRCEFDIIDSAEYFVKKIDEICKNGYVPSTEDILMTRTKTVGIVQQEFNSGDMNILMVDVGGQRNERRKWIHAFDNVTSIIFITALSEYDQRLEEDRNKNRMHESLELFDSIFNGKTFNRKSIIIFYNKKDLFEKKIAKKDLKCCFKDYDGGTNYEAAVEFIKKKFSEKNKNKKRELYEHVTTATDTKNVKFVFEACSKIILRALMRQQGMM